MAESIVSDINPEESCFRPNYYKYKQNQPGVLPTSIKGSIKELKVCAYFLELGYEVFRNVSATGKGDIVIWKRGSTPIVIDVKSVNYCSYRRKDGAISLNRQMMKSKCRGVITVGITDEDKIICDEWDFVEEKQRV